MKTKLLDFPIIIETDTETGSDKSGYSAYCPSLGVADDGDSIEEALENLTQTIKFHLKCLESEGEKLPSSSRSVFTSIQIPFSYA